MELSAEKSVVDISDNTITINGENVCIPCHINELKKLFGKPRKYSDKKYEPTFFIWDNAGIYCAAFRFAIIHHLVVCIGIKTNPDAESDFYPKSEFKGEITVCGEPWEEVMHGGEDIEIARRKNIGAYSLVSVYANGEKGDTDITCGAYAGLEIHLPESEKTDEQQNL